MSATEIKTKAGSWTVRTTDAGGLEVEFKADWPLGGYFEAQTTYDKDRIVLSPRRCTPSCSGGG